MEGKIIQVYPTIYFCSDGESLKIQELLNGEVIELFECDWCSVIIFNAITCAQCGGPQYTSVKDMKKAYPYPLHNGKEE